MSKEMDSDIEESDSKKIRPDHLRRLNEYIFRHWKPLAMGMGALAVTTSASLYEPRLWGRIIDDAILPKDEQKLKEFVVLFVLVSVARVSGVIAQNYFFELLGQRVTQSLRLKLFSHLQRQPISVFDKNPAGRLLTRVTNDISSMAEMFSAGFVAIAGNCLLVLGILGWLFVLDWKLALVSVSVFPVLVGLAAYFSLRLKIAYREARSRLSALNSFLAENLMGMKIVQLFNRQKMHLERFRKINTWYTDAQVASIKIFSIFQPSITLVSAISVALVIGYGGVETREGRLPYGILVAFISYVLLLFQPLREIADKWNIFLSGMASAERVFSVLDWTPEIEEDRPRKLIRPIKGIKGEIVFDRVWFAYEDQHWILKDFSLTIPAGGFVGIVGHTGSGKTTLIHLLLRFYEIQRGRILLDGKDIRELDKRELRASIGLIQQDGFLFSGSLLDNITFWHSRPGTAESLANVLMAAGLTERVAGRISDPDALFERASNLSIGERQVLAFARAWEKKPKLWILDEATANMDSETEDKIQKLLNSKENLTKIVVAHRLASIRAAHKILVLHKGALIESGTHEELMKLNGFYSRLYRYQEKAYAGAAIAQGNQTV